MFFDTFVLFQFSWQQFLVTHSFCFRAWFFWMWLSNSHLFTFITPRLKISRSNLVINVSIYLNWLWTTFWYCQQIINHGKWGYWYFVFVMIYIYFCFSKHSFFQLNLCSHYMQVNPTHPLALQFSHFLQTLWYQQV